VCLGGERPERGRARSSEGPRVGTESGQSGHAVARVVPRRHPAAQGRGHHQPRRTLLGARLHLPARRLRPQLQIQGTTSALRHQQGIILFTIT